MHGRIIPIQYIEKATPKSSGTPTRSHKVSRCVLYIHYDYTTATWIPHTALFFATSFHSLQHNRSVLLTARGAFVCYTEQ